MDFAITVDNNGNADILWTKPEDITTNIYLSLNITKGLLFNKPSFGLNLNDIKKITDKNIEKIKQRIENALQWLIDVGKAKSILVTVERDTIVDTRINYKIEAIQADGLPVIVTNFRDVGGPADGFTI